MGIRALCAAAAVMVAGVGAAEAVTVRYDLRYEDTVLDNPVIFDDEDNFLWDFEPLSVHNAPWVLPTLYPGAKKGDIFQAYIEIEDPEDPDGEGPLAPVCYIGSFDCRVVWRERAVGADPLFVVADHFTVWQNGDTLTVTSWGKYTVDGYTISGNGYRGHTESITTTFTIVPMAPVPLPATAALLPLSFGALAMMRRRRRQGGGSGAARKLTVGSILAD